MKISERINVFSWENREIEQRGWYRMGSRIQTEFSMRSLLQPSTPTVHGHLAVFARNDVIEGIQFVATPSDVIERSDEYASKEINYLEFRGDFDGKIRVTFDHQLAVTPIFDGDGGGWEANVGTSASEWPIGNLDPFETSCEKLVANIICTNEIQISIGNLTPDPRFGKINTPLLRVALRDLDGLRQLIADIFGRPYVEKLLRINGYEIS